MKVSSTHTDFKDACQSVQYQFSCSSMRVGSGLADTTLATLESSVVISEVFKSKI